MHSTRDCNIVKRLQSEKSVANNNNSDDENHGQAAPPPPPTERRSNHLPGAGHEGKSQTSLPRGQRDHANHYTMAELVGGADRI